MESLSENGVSTTQEPGQEKYVSSLPGHLGELNIINMTIAIQMENFSLR